MKSKFGIVILVWIVLGGVCYARAETVPSITGRVTDPQEKAIPGAAVVVFARDGSVHGRTTADAGGVYRFGAIPTNGCIRTLSPHSESPSTVMESLYKSATKLFG